MIGTTTKAAIRALQEKYGLEATGQLEPETFDLIESIAASQGTSMRKMKQVRPHELKPIRKSVRLNMQGPHVRHAQAALSYFGYAIDGREYNEGRFGKTTRQAVMDYQHDHALPVTGKLEQSTLIDLDRKVKQVHPDAYPRPAKYRVRGSVRNELWKGMPGANVQLWLKPVKGDAVLLTQRRTLHNGFYDMPFDLPRDPASGRMQTGFMLQVKAFDADQELIGVREWNRPERIMWTNFTRGPIPYRGTVLYDERTKAIRHAIGESSFHDMTGSQIMETARVAGIDAEDVLKFVLCHRIAKELDHPALRPSSLFAFLSQNMPPVTFDMTALPDEEQRLDEWTELIASKLVFMDQALIRSGFDQAIEDNLIPIDDMRRKEDILSAFDELKRHYALVKPILSGNGSLQDVLHMSPQMKAHTDAVVDTFLKYRDFDSGFWDELRDRPERFGGIAAVDEFEMSLRLGAVTDHFRPMVELIKHKLESDEVPKVHALAGMRAGQLAAWIEENGNQVPSSVHGKTTKDRVEAYAARMEQQIERMFPTLTLVERTARRVDRPLSRIEDIRQLLHQHPETNLQQDSADQLFKRWELDDQELLEQVRVMQRVQRIAPHADAGEALLAHRIHHSAQIVAQGKERFLEQMEAAEYVDRRTALTMFANAEFQYAQVLQLLTEYRAELNRTNPRAIADRTVQTDEMSAYGDQATLETLFGSLDFCHCSHCQSVYSPAAYLADLLRFLDSHRSRSSGKTVKDQLFERRPDIGRIKLNCENTETPMPYIDLVNEVLEQAVAFPDSEPDSALQTTLTAPELRAYPEYVIAEAYEVLKTADYPLTSSFHLQQEEARAYLQHLGVKRHELMRAFQPGAKAEPDADDATIAGEWFGMSTHETNIVTATEATGDRQSLYWGFDASQTEIRVSDFLHHSKLSYEQLLELLATRWIHGEEDEAPMTIQRPQAVCDLDKQKLVGLSPERLDCMHRFLRLWRHTDWSMRELDQLIRIEKLGSGQLDHNSLNRLASFQQLQERLGLETEKLATFYGDLNTEHDEPSPSARSVRSLYARLLLDPTWAEPDFTLPLSPDFRLDEHRAALQAAFALNESDLESLLVQLEDDAPVLKQLSAIARQAWLAQSLEMTISEWLIMQAWTDTDVFASPQATLAFIEQKTAVDESGFRADELDDLLHVRNDSPYGIRNETIQQSILSLREELGKNQRRTTTVQSHLSDEFSLSVSQTRLLLDHVRIGGKSLADLLSDEALTAQNDDGSYVHDVSESTFPQQYLGYRYMHKASQFVTRHAIEAEDLAWLIQYASVHGLFNPAQLPVEEEPAASLFPAWYKLWQWLGFKSRYPEPEEVHLRMIMDKARDGSAAKAEIVGLLSQLTQWDVRELQTLVDVLGFEHGETDSDFVEIQTLLRLERCYRWITRIGVSASKLSAWASRDEDGEGEQATVVRQIRQVVKSKYDHEVWLEKITPIEDALREQKRDALVAYLLATSQRTRQEQIEFDGSSYPNPACWRDEYDLLNYYLIDVDMSSCQLTSRIKQAISSVQMYTQRCLLGLEKPFVEVSRAEQQETASDNSWNQWKWMKSYRIWEANRKVFLYPENWIEPELRDDKTPFFKQLESEIMQNDITDEHVQAALRQYVQKVHEVARLDITGAYYELDDTDPRDDLPPDINRLHLIGRTRSHPAIYYYRHFDLNMMEWTPWEKIEAGHPERSGYTGRIQPAAVFVLAHIY